MISSDSLSENLSPRCCQSVDLEASISEIVAQVGADHYFHDLYADQLVEIMLDWLSP